MPKKLCLLTISCLTLLVITRLGFYTPVSAQQPVLVSSPTTGATDDSRPCVPGEILVTLHGHATTQQIGAMNAVQGMTILEQHPELNLYRLKVTSPVKDAVTVVQSQPFVAHARPNYILAEVEGDVITLLDMETFIEHIPPFIRQQYTIDEMKGNLLQSLVDYKIFAKVAESDNLNKLPEVQRQISAAIEKILAQVYLNRLQQSIQISEEELRGHYESHLKEFQIPEQIKMQQVSVKTAKEAEEILAKIKSAAESGRTGSGSPIDTGVQWGPESGWLGRGRMDPALENAVFALNKGEISDIMETRLGYYLIKVVDKRGPIQQAFSEVRDKIMATLQGIKTKNYTDEKRQELREKYKARLHTAMLSEVKVRSTEKPDQESVIRMLQQMLQKSY